MKNNFLTIAVAAAFMLVLLLLSDPFMLWMPPPAQMTVLLCAAVCACVWVGFVFYERSHDEREATHAMFAGRVAYLSGISVLTLALVVQGLSHQIDQWIPISLGVMVLAKLAARLYSGRYR
jgi:hypothetical protein